MEALQPDPRRAGEFYAAVFGWGLRVDGHRLTAHAGGRAVAGLGPLGSLPSAAWLTRVRVDDVDEAVARAVQAGGSLVARPSGEEALLADPAGAAFAVGDMDRGAELVNQPGSWDLSTLATPAPRAAEAFYGGLFGWRAEPAGAITLWRLPGYVGGLPDQPVPRDTVAVMTPAVRATWSVDFRVDDVDGCAEHAASLGARIRRAPHDTPGFRTALLVDPQGAPFSITRFR